MEELEIKEQKEVPHAVTAPLLCPPASTRAYYYILLKRCGQYNTINLDSRAVYQENFTYIISFQLHSAAEYKGIEVGLLENFIEGSFVLKVRSICSEPAQLSNAGLSATQAGGFLDLPHCAGVRTERRRRLLASPTP